MRLCRCCDARMHLLRCEELGYRTGFLHLVDVSGPESRACIIHEDFTKESYHDKVALSIAALTVLVTS